MADDGSAQSPTVWPLPRLWFQVKWGSEVLAFQEVSGLDIEAVNVTNRPNRAGPALVRRDRGP